MFEPRVSRFGPRRARTIRGSPPSTGRSTGACHRRSFHRTGTV